VERLAGLASSFYSQLYILTFRYYLQTGNVVRKSLVDEAESVNSNDPGFYFDWIFHSRFIEASAKAEIAIHFLIIRVKFTLLRYRSTDRKIY